MAEKRRLLKEPSLNAAREMADDDLIQVQQMSDSGAPRTGWITYARLRDAITAEVRADLDAQKTQLKSLSKKL